VWQSKASHLTGKQTEKEEGASISLPPSRICLLVTQGLSAKLSLLKSTPPPKTSIPETKSLLHGTWDPLKIQTAAMYKGLAFVSHIYIYKKWFQE
jgi:hypothetical protein